MAWGREYTQYYTACMGAPVQQEPEGGKLHSCQLCLHCAWEVLDRNPLGLG